MASTGVPLRTKRILLPSSSTTCHSGSRFSNWEIALSTGNAVVFWLFARALFDDGFKLRRWHAAPWAAVVALSLVNCLVLVPAQTLGPRISAIAISVISLCFVALAVGQTIASWSTDLVEERRRLRVFVVVATAIYAGLNAVLQLFVAGGGGASS